MLRGVFVVADVIFGVCSLALAALEDLDVRVGLGGERGLKAMTVGQAVRSRCSVISAT